MSRILAVGCCLALLMTIGCGRGGKFISKLAKGSGARNASRVVPAAAPKSKSLLKVVPKQSPPSQTFGVPQRAVAATVSSRLPRILSDSKALGTYLKSRQAHLPARVYAQLWSQWQRNDAELISFERQLSEGGLADGRRQRLEAQVAELEKKNAEIERLAREYG